MATDRTAYSLKDEHGEWTTITLPKYIADILQRLLSNVHEWLQLKYNDVVAKAPWLSRREKGDKVRMLAFNAACETIGREDLF